MPTMAEGAYDMGQNASIGTMHNTADPETITQEKISFDQVNDDVNAVRWLPGSATNMLAATRDSLLICDIR